MKSEHLFRFEGVEVDLRAGELRKNGKRIKLQEQPLQILRMLLELPGQTVTREEIQKQLWPDDTFVEYDHSINAAIQRLRQALGDSAEHPRFVETMARRGYRFIAPVAAVCPPATCGGDAAATVGAGLVSAQAERPPGAPLRRMWMLTLAAVAFAAVVVLLALNVAGLRDRIAGPAPPKIESIAVLPLENLSGDPEQEYFSDGMTEALIANLGKIGTLRVISRTSVMTYKGKRKPLPEIARELNVDAVVEGTVQRSGDRVRITANLLHAPRDRHLWGKDYERDLRDVLALQGEVARAVAKEVRATLTPEVRARLANDRAVDPEAHELYLKGMQLLGQDRPETALELFQAAVQKDRDFARGHLGIAQAYIALGNKVQLGSVQAYTKGKASARKALELDETIAEAHVCLANAFLLGDWDWPGAAAESKRALELNPNSASARLEHVFYLSVLGRTPDAIQEARRAMEINPLMAEPYRQLGLAYYFGRRYDEAIPQFQKAAEIGGPSPWNHLELGWAYREKGMYDKAIAEIDQCVDGPVKWGHLGNTYARAGRQAEARKLLQKLIEHRHQAVGTWEIAMIYAGLGDKRQALEWLERAYQVRDKGMTFLRVETAFDPLRADPRFQEVLRRMNFPP